MSGEKSPVQRAAEKGAAPVAKPVVSPSSHVGVRMMHEAPDDMRKMVAGTHCLATAGVPVSDIFTWISNYGVPIVLAALKAAAPLFESNATASIVIQFMVMAMNALQNGLPIPPLPSA